MHVYSSNPFQRFGQMVADAVAIAFVVAAVLLGRWAHEAVAALATFGRGLENAGTGFSTSMSDAATRIGGVPLIGDAASAPFREAAGAGQFLKTAGQDQQSTVELAAAVVGWVVVLVPVLILAVVWLIPRIRFMVRASAARRLLQIPGGVEVLAIRALSTARPAELLSISSDPVAGWRRGDREVVSALADMTLKRAGVRENRSSPGVSER